MAMIELVDFNELYNPNQKEVKKATTRRGRSKKADVVATEVESTETTSETENNA